MDYASSIGFELLHLEFSPIKGPEGNIEYLLHGVKAEKSEEEKHLSAEAVVKDAHGTLAK